MISLSDRTSSLRPRIAGLALALAVGLSGAAGIASAQEATPTGAEGVVCAEVLEAGATPVSSPEASAVAAATAIPVADEMQGEPVTDEAIIAELTEVASSCNPEASGGIEVGSVEQFDTDLYGIEYQYLQGRQVIRVLEMYSVENDTWTLRQQQSRSPETDEDTITIAAKIGGDPAIETSPASFSFTPAMRVNITNRDASDLSLALFSTSEEVDPASLAGTDAASLPETMELQGETLVIAGSTGEMLFEGLEEGTYMLVVLDGSDAVVAASPLTIDPPLDLGL
jgi:hypothetical protein